MLCSGNSSGVLLRCQKSGWVSSSSEGRRGRAHPGHRTRSFRNRLPDCMVAMGGDWRRFHTLRAPPASSRSGARGGLPIALRGMAWGAPNEPAGFEALTFQERSRRSSDCLLRQCLLKTDACTRARLGICLGAMSHINATTQPRTSTAGTPPMGRPNPMARGRCLQRRDSVARSRAGQSRMGGLRCCPVYSAHRRMLGAPRQHRQNP